jgi:hypothetical protein
MDVIIYANTSSPTPYLRILCAGLDDLPTIALRFLDPYGIPYVIADESVIPNAGTIPTALTVDVSSGVPVFDWDLNEAKTQATYQNAAYWQKQYNQGLLGLAISNDYQLNLAIATPADDRTADQVAAIEFMTGINGLQQSVQDSIDAATTGEEIVQILSQLG